MAVFLTVYTELEGPKIWSYTRDNQKGKFYMPMVFYDVSPGPQGEWELYCNIAKSPDGECTKWVKQYPLIVYGAITHKPYPHAGAPTRGLAAARSAPCSLLAACPLLPAVACSLRSPAPCGRLL